MTLLSIVLVVSSILSPFIGQGESPRTVPPEEAAQHIREKTDPGYPEMAKIAHIQGDVVIRISISDAGAVTNSKPVSGHPILIQAALDAIKKWHYLPFLVNGRPVPVETVVTIPFSLGSREEVTVPPEQAAQHLRKKTDPVYPQMAKIAHIEGNVVIRITISDAGEVVTLKAISGHPILGQAALDAVRKWRYSPFLLNGKPVSVETVVTIPFSLPTSSH